MNTHRISDGLSLLEREAPRVSLNKIAEFTTTRSPLRRRNIVAAQRRPPFHVRRYNVAKNAMTRFLLTQDRQALDSELQLLQESQGRTSADEEMIASCVEAIENFVGMIDSLDFLVGVERCAGAHSPERLLIGGVEVSVRPELILSRVRRGKREVGAIKLSVAKSYAHDEDSGLLAATGVQLFGEDQLAQEARVSHGLCCVIDVFTRTIYTAPRHSKLRQRCLEAGCREFRLLWEDV